jgi:hypothetical protein
LRYCLDFLCLCLGVSDSTDLGRSKNPADGLGYFFDQDRSWLGEIPKIYDAATGWHPFFTSLSFNFSRFLVLAPFRAVSFLTIGPHE